MKLSVLMVTYNHEKYIAQALDSILMQVVDFNYEVVVGEDCSTDKTRKIILEYKKKYPDKFKLLLNDNNMGAGSNFNQTYEACSGEYVAILDGDDFWTYPLKLQKQVDFLDENPDFSICSHNVTVKNEDGSIPDSEWLGRDYCEVITLKDLLKYGSGGATCSLLFRNRIFGDFPDWYFTLPGGDWTLQILCANNGKLRYFKEPMGVYRRHEGGVSSVKDDKRKEIAVYLDGGVNICETLNIHFKFRYDNDLRYNLAYYFYPNLIRALLINNEVKEARKYAIRVLRETLAWQPVPWKTLCLAATAFMIFPAMRRFCLNIVLRFC